MPTAEASSSLVSSFVTEASADEPYTIKPQSQDSRTTLNENRSATVDAHDSENSVDGVPSKLQLSDGNGAKPPRTAVQDEHTPYDR